MVHNKRVKYIYALLGTMLICLLVSQCTGPIYFNKELKKDIESMVYLVPSSYFGSFLVAMDKPDNTWKKIPFSAWEQFDNDVNIAIRNSFTKRGVRSVVLNDQQVGEGLKTLIANDTIKNNHQQYLTLQSVYGDDYDTLMKEIGPGLLLVFTEFQMTRVFPNIKVRVKYYIYSTPGGGLMMVNNKEKEYVMTGQAVKALDIKDPNFKENLEKRLYGLWPEEKDSYKNICKLFCDKLIKAIAKQCLSK